MISIGKWGGFYLHRGWSYRLCIGWIAFSFFPVDGDEILDLARIGSESLIKDDPDAPEAGQ